MATTGDRFVITIVDYSNIFTKSVNEKTEFVKENSAAITYGMGNLLFIHILSATIGS